MLARSRQRYRIASIVAPEDSKQSRDEPNCAAAVSAIYK